VIGFSVAGHISPVRIDRKSSIAPGLPLRLLADGGVPQELAPPIAPADRPATRLAARHRGRLVFLEPHEIWAFQAAGRLTFVHSSYGKFDLDFSLVELEASFCRPLTRVHRNWLVDLAQVRAFEREDGGASLFVGSGMDEQRGVRVPVSRDLAHGVRERLLADATGVRHSGSGNVAEMTDHAGSSHSRSRVT
jgi:hypothetical protein